MDSQVDSLIHGVLVLDWNKIGAEMNSVKGGKATVGLDEDEIPALVTRTGASAEALSASVPSHEVTIEPFAVYGWLTVNQLFKYRFQRDGVVSSLYGRRPDDIATEVTFAEVESAAASIGMRPIAEEEWESLARSAGTSTPGASSKRTWFPNFARLATWTRSRFAPYPGRREPSQRSAGLPKFDDTRFVVRGPLGPDESAVFRRDAIDAESRREDVGGILVRSATAGVDLIRRATLDASERSRFVARQLAEQHVELCGIERFANDQPSSLGPSYNGVVLAPFERAIAAENERTDRLVAGVVIVAPQTKCRDAPDPAGYLVELEGEPPVVQLRSIADGATRRLGRAKTTIVARAEPAGFQRKPALARREQ
ncbi:MAG TPA: hypothetical protein PLV92_25420, partial [Pirellulaceae bacterium]|nr:hypothetical protein [Pirellulaceae bacterium]